MKKKYILTVLVGLLNLPVFSQHPPLDQNWDIVFEDNFNTFNSALWRKDDCIHGDEPQHYIPNNVVIENGQLVLIAKNENYICTKPNCNCNNSTFNYTSGQIASNYGLERKYGYYEIYAKLPSYNAFFPAFWLWNASKTPPNCWYNEIDIMEAAGCVPSWVSSNYQVTFDCLEEKRVAKRYPCNYANGSYHWYGVEWDSEKITWYVDRKTVRQIPNNGKGIGIQHSLNIYINLALYPPPNTPGWEECTCYLENNDNFPAKMYVDQANGYKLKYDCNKNETINNFNDFSNYIYKVKKSITLGGGTTLPAGSNIFLRATDYIELQNGFTVANGAELYLDNNPCDGISSNSKTIK